MKLNLVVLAKKYSIYKFEMGSVLPDWIYSSDFYSITKTNDELSIVAFQIDTIAENIKVSKDWRIFKVKGPLDFSLIGIIAEISSILKGKKIPIFTISAYDTDYFLVKQKDSNNAIKALKNKGHIITIEK
jgi:hypothetical protein